ncbi:hypothetical protein K502DRAFT_365199 [Neoconidiobolus thromboides FSU 785]|nr:hypothetical protein K502DRAFT_365199 [Neoconidiobolus thromboides FSU 785]
MMSYETQQVLQDLTKLGYGTRRIKEDPIKLISELIEEVIDNRKYKERVQLLEDALNCVNEEIEPICNKVEELGLENKKLKEEALNLKSRDYNRSVLIKKYTNEIENNKFVVQQLNKKINEQEVIFEKEKRKLVDLMQINMDNNDVLNRYTATMTIDEPLEPMRIKNSGYYKPVPIQVNMMKLLEKNNMKLKNENENLILINEQQQLKIDTLTKDINKLREKLSDNNDNMNKKTGKYIEVEEYEKLINNEQQNEVLCEQIETLEKEYLQKEEEKEEIIKSYNLIKNKNKILINKMNNMENLLREFEVNKKNNEPDYLKQKEREMNLKINEQEMINLGIKGEIRLLKEQLKKDDLYFKSIQNHLVYLQNKIHRGFPLTKSDLDLNTIKVEEIELNNNNSTLNFNQSMNSKFNEVALILNLISQSTNNINNSETQKIKRYKKERDNLRLLYTQAIQELKELKREFRNKLVINIYYNSRFRDSKNENN